MTGYLVLPVGVVLLTVIGAASVQRRLPPRWAALVLAIIAAQAALATLAAAGAVAFGYVAEATWFVDLTGWCPPVLSHHDRIDAPSGLSAALALAFMAAAGLRAGWRRNRAIGPPDDRGGVDILPSAEPVAYALPGKPGRIVVSVGMLQALTPEERAVLFAHEQAHLDLRHDRYVAVTDLAASFVPALRPLGSRVRHATERWADEVAARHVGDRRLVARAIIVQRSRASKGTHALGLAAVGVRARVEALLEIPDDDLVARLVRRPQLASPP